MNNLKFKICISKYVMNFVFWKIFLIQKIHLKMCNSYDYFKDIFVILALYGGACLKTLGLRMQLYKVAVDFFFWVQRN